MHHRKQSPHISVKTVEYGSCTNFFSSSTPISVIEVHKYVELEEN